MQGSWIVVIYTSNTPNFSIYNPISQVTVYTSCKMSSKSTSDGIKNHQKARDVSSADTSAVDGEDIIC